MIEYREYNFTDDKWDAIMRAGLEAADTLDMGFPGREVFKKLAMKMLATRLILVSFEFERFTGPNVVKVGLYKTNQHDEHPHFEVMALMEAGRVISKERFDLKPELV